MNLKWWWSLHECHYPPKSFWGMLQLHLLYRKRQSLHRFLLYDTIERSITSHIRTSNIHNSWRRWSSIFLEVINSRTVLIKDYSNQTSSTRPFLVLSFPNYQQNRQCPRDHINCWWQKGCLNVCMAIRNVNKHVAKSRLSQCVVAQQVLIT